MPGAVLHWFWPKCAVVSRAKNYFKIAIFLFMLYSVIGFVSYSFLYVHSISLLDLFCLSLDAPVKFQLWHFDGYSIGFFFCFTQCEFSFFSRDAVNDRVYFYSKCPLKSWKILLRVDGICFRLCGKSLSFSDFKNCVANPGVSWRRQTWQIQTQDAVYYDYTSWDF